LISDFRLFLTGIVVLSRIGKQASENDTGAFTDYRGDSICTNLLEKACVIFHRKVSSVRSPKDCGLKNIETVIFYLTAGLLI
jgi:hypothetical protein